MNSPTLEAGRTQNEGKAFSSWEDAVTWLVNQPDQQELVRDCYFDRPVIGAVQRYATSPEWMEIRRRYLPKVPGRALDIGAGNGIVSYALAKEGWGVVALEPDPSEFVGANAIRKIAAQESLSIEVVEAFGEDLPFDDASFDLIMARQVMHHANDLEGMYHQLSRVLRPGGMLLAFRDHVVDSQKGLEQFLDEHPLHNIYGGENAFPLSEYQDAARQAGLRITKTLRQFESVINFAPRTSDELCEMISDRVRLPILKQLAGSLLRNPMLFPVFMSILSRVDRRPGRIISLVCEKPKIGE